MGTVNRLTIAIFVLKVVIISRLVLDLNCGWSGGAKVLDKLPVTGRPTIWMTVGQRPIAHAVGAGGDCLDIFTLLYPSSPLSPSLWETARYRLNYSLKRPLNPKQPTKHQFFTFHEISVW